MLIELRVRNLAVIRDLSLELGDGLNVLSGETGAGKSILVGALGLLLGERASSDSVRQGAERAVVEGVFDLSKRPDLCELVRTAGFDLEDGDLLLLRREVVAEGRSRAWINGSPATAGAVGELGRALVDFHGQHEHQTLLQGGEQRGILDAFGGAEEEAEAVVALHRRLTELRERMDARRSRLAELSERADFVRFQLREIEDAEVDVPSEDVTVSETLSRLEHAEELAMGTGSLHELLYSGDGSVSEQVAAARELLSHLSRFDPSLDDLRVQVDEVFHRVTEVGRTVEAYASRVEVDPEGTERLRRRADLLFRLKRKFGPQLADVIDTRERLRAELDEIEGAGEGDARMEDEMAGIRAELASRAAVLSQLRTQAALGLARQVEKVLPELGLAGARFRVDLEPLSAVEAGGAERVRFLASLNTGFELQPLRRIASGGELSRVMLALKSILAGEDRVPTLVFDEIDAGVGGAVAVAVGVKLRQVADRHQVFVITHLAQIASRGRRHLRVEKADADGVVETDVRLLEGEARVSEIARMLGGDPGSETSREHARELLTLS